MEEKTDRCSIYGDGRDQPHAIRIQTCSINPNLVKICQAFDLRILLTGLGIQLTGLGI